MTPYNLKKLLLPLLIGVNVIIGLVLYFAGKFDTSSLFLNVFSEIIGIVVTVWFVERTLSEHETDRWKNAKFKVSWRIEEFINKTLDHLVKTIDLEGITMGVGWKPTGRIDLTSKLNLIIDPELLNKNMWDRNNPYTKKLYEKLPTLENIEAFEKFTDEGYKIFEMFGNHLDPEVIDYLLKSLEHMEFIKTKFPFYLNILEKTLTDPETTEIYKEGVKESTLVGMASVFYQTVRDLVHLHKILNTEM